LYINNLLLSPSPSLSLSLQVIGLALVGFGIYLLVGDNTLRVLTGNEFASDGALILVAGVITAIIAFVGILGAAGKWPIVLGFVSQNL
jgi:multisubunit Na+/H+ antiporter MnhC subunit